MDGYYFTAIDGTQFGTASGYAFKDCRFENFEIDGSGLTYEKAGVNGKGMFITCMERAIFRNLYIHHTIGTGLGCDFLVDSVIDSCNVSYCGRNFGKEGATVGQSGIGVGSGWKESESLAITNCVTNYNGNNGVFVEVQGINDPIVRSRGARISNCYAEGNRIGFSNKGSGHTIYSDCYAYNNTEYGFYYGVVYGAINITANCFAEANGVAGFGSLYSGGADSYINCVSFNNKGRGYYFQTKGTNSNLIMGRGVRLTHCIALNNDKYGLDITSDKLSEQGIHSIDNCSLTKNKMTGLYALNIQNLNVTNTIISKNNGNGFELRAVAADSQVVIANTYIQDNAENGFYANLHNDARVLKIKDCVVTDNGTALISGKRNGLDIGGSSNVEITGSKIGSYKTDSSQGTGVLLVSSKDEAVFLVDNNDLIGNSFEALNTTGAATSNVIATRNKGYNNLDAINLITTTGGTYTVDKKPYPLRFYVSSSETASLSIRGTKVIDSVNSFDIVVPANTSGYVITYTGAPKIYAVRQ